MDRLIAGALLAWLLATIGFNMEAQLEREGRRGGSRRLPTGSPAPPRCLGMCSRGWVMRCHAH